MADRLADKARKTVLGIEIPRDELAFRLAQVAIGLIAPPGTNATEALNAMCLTAAPGGTMGGNFRRQADTAVLYFHECINAAREPS